MIFNPKTTKTRKWRHLLLRSYQVPGRKYNGKICEYGVRKPGFKPLLCHLFFDANSLYFFFYKREVIEQWHQPSFHLWFCDSPWLLHLGVHIRMGHIALFSPTELICSPFQGRWKAWRNAILRKQIHYSSCQTFIKCIIVGRKYLKMPFFLPCWIKA